MDQKRAEQALGAAAALTAAGAAAVAGKAGVERVKRRRRLAPEYGMRAGEPAGEAIARIVRGQLDAAIVRLEGESGEDRGTAVHEARKSFKRARAALRLARPPLGDQTYRRENTLLRDAGRRLAGARDAQVVLETLDGLCERDGDELGVAELRRALAERHEASAELLAGDDAAIAAVVEELRALRERAGGWTFEADGLAALAPGFERIYRRGRRACRRARAEPTTESLHELRKRAKDLWHAAQIVQPAGAPKMRRVAKRAHALSDLVGEEHDLAVLIETARSRPHDLDGDALARLELLSDRRRATLRRKALRCAESLYRRKPRAMARRLRRATAAA